ncbi:hypothetical protein CDFC105_62274 [Clostridioides difficile]|nr:hypothetical protein CDFC105_62274 [Clostridioides difficile]
MSVILVHAQDHLMNACLLYTSDAADDMQCVNLGGCPTGNEKKSIFFFAMPMLIGSLFQQLYNTADSIIVGRFIGKEAMAAVSGANFFFQAEDGIRDHA